MRYFSTRGEQSTVTAAQAIVKGLADDGGLFVPEQIPTVDLQFIADLVNLSYQERAKKILPLYLTDFTAEEIANCVERAYNSFDDESIVPLYKIDEQMYILELWHGPTSAFKDMALQILPHFIVTALKKLNKQEELLILVATSGDTGKAALEGFKNVEQTKILVFYPNNGVSQIQKAQMVTQLGNNVKVMAIEGNFDDAQTGVKNIFNDDKIKEALKAVNVELSSANSINWGRLLPQIVYYFSAYASLLAKGSIKLGQEVDFTVPTGNFGNILAGYYAKAMGLPVGKLVCASNANNVLTDFLNTGKYSRNRDFYKTISPSMDILISSNLERLLYHVTGNTGQVKAWMEELKTKGCYTVDADTLAKIQSVFQADCLTDEETKKEIHNLYKKANYVMDTHTAIAYAVADKYKGHNKMVVLSTASPYKFNENVLEALNIEYGHADEFTMLEILAQHNIQPIPAGLKHLKDGAVIHKGVCTKEEMINEVMNFVGK